MTCPAGPSRSIRRRSKRRRILRNAFASIFSPITTIFLLTIVLANVAVDASTAPVRRRKMMNFPVSQISNSPDEASTRSSGRQDQKEDVRFLQLHGLDKAQSDISVARELLFEQQDDRLMTPYLKDLTPETASNMDDVQLFGKQTSDGYVFGRKSDLKSYVDVRKTAVASFLSRRDLRISHPPLIPNSNSRLLIGLILLCIMGLGVLTITAQQLYRRYRNSVQPKSPLRRRSGDGRTSRSSHRNDLQFVQLMSSDASMEEEEEGIKTPPALLRRSSGAIPSTLSSPYDVDGSDTETDTDRRSPHDLHYLPLPLGLGIGFSYGQINDRLATKARVERASVKRWSHGKRERSDSDLSMSTSALPSILASISGSDGLRSRARSFKDLCKDALQVASVSDVDADADAIAKDLSTASTSRRTPSLISVDASNLENGSGSTTPTAPGLCSQQPLMSLSDTGLENSPSVSESRGKARYSAVDEPTTLTHTLVDFGQAADDPLLSVGNDIARPASSPATTLPSLMPRHPQVEQLRRQGRTETGKRVGKGTPTNAKAL